jgi:hypothetical protein
MAECQYRNLTIWLADSGIVWVRTRLEADLTIEDAREIIAHLASEYGKVPRPVLVDISQMRSITREARSYFGGPETAAIETATALVVKSHLSRAIGNFFIGINRSVLPTRLFSNEADAAQWLGGFLAK